MLRSEKCQSIFNRSFLSFACNDHFDQARRVKRLEHVVRVDIVMESRPSGLRFNSWCHFCKEVSDKLNISLCLGPHRSDRYVIDCKILTWKRHKLQKMNSPHARGDCAMEEFQYQRCVKSA